MPPISIGLIGLIRRIGPSRPIWIPAFAGMTTHAGGTIWIPAFAGMTTHAGGT